jgi:hypothetical protein
VERKQRAPSRLRPGELRRWRANRQSARRPNASCSSTSSSGSRRSALVAAFESIEEDGVYRYYHQSFTIYSLQASVKRARQLFEDLAPQGMQLNPWLSTICEEGYAHQFDLARSNQHWHQETRPILEAFWHCLYFLRQLARYGRELDQPPQILPYGWAAVLWLYDIR